MGQQEQSSRINDALHEIHKDISAPLTAKTLAKTAAYSEAHFHRLFRNEVGQSVNQYIRRTRLEHAANQLMFDQASTVLEIAQKCGFHSLSSFTSAFKAAFTVTPGQWRAVESHQERPPYLADPDIAAGYLRIQGSLLPPPKLLVLEPQAVAYVRHQGYGRSIRSAWELLMAWAEIEGRSKDIQLGLHHSNPAWVALEQCRYVACLAIEKPVLRRGLVSEMVIPGGLHAAFKLCGIYGDLLPYLSKILEEWLPASGYKMATTPAFVRYRKNQFLEEDEQFDLTFYLPISVF